jgi:tetratricopeptide (TPR) repeat protein
MGIRLAAVFPLFVSAVLLVIPRVSAETSDRVQGYRVQVQYQGARATMVSTLKGSQGSYLAFCHSEGPHASEFHDVPEGEFRLHVELPSGAYALKTIRIGPEFVRDGRTVKVVLGDSDFRVTQDRLSGAHAVGVGQLQVSAKARRRFEQAWKEMSARQWERARQHLEEAIQQAPDYFDAWVNRGVVARSQSDLEAAEQSFRQALRLRPRAFEAAFNLAEVLEDAGQAERALEVARLAHEIRPDDPMANAQLGMLLVRAGRHPDAIPVLRKAIAEDPLSPYRPHLLLAVAFEANRQQEEAAECLEEWLRLNPTHPDRRTVAAKHAQLLPARRQ